MAPALRRQVTGDAAAAAREDIQRVGAEGSAADLLAVTRALSAGSAFRDPDFEPGSVGCPMPRGCANPTQWHRPAEVEYDRVTREHSNSRTRWALFNGPPACEDVCQGALGDCWFLSALSVLAEFQGGRLVMGMFPCQRSVSDSGSYVVRLCHGGAWRNILIDDLLPTTGGERGMLSRSLVGLNFAGSRGFRLWAALVEKAYAKLCGGYGELAKNCFLFFF